MRIGGWCHWSRLTRVNAIKPDLCRARDITQLGYTGRPAR